MRYMYTHTHIYIGCPEKNSFINASVFHVTQWDSFQTAQIDG